MALQSTFAQYLLSDVQGKVSGWIEHVATIPEKVELRQVHEAMAGPMESMRPYQREYLNDVLKNKGSVRHFHKYYCKGDDKNPFVNGASLHYFCSQIEASELLTI
ncbi:hypothetical protein GCM10007391_11550 [Alteromonas halophila]|uniref:Uncharacterized protein n=2 Tax=Alteromonas halophila TaxID=516698 RepID=A0A918JGK4_9ALTE|nr:hypothetical protein GCM10007391_11550 [Alteromonas halophila]